MNALLEQIRDGQGSMVEMEKEGLKHVFMEVLEMLRAEEATNVVELGRWTDALATGKTPWIMMTAAACERSWRRELLVLEGLPPTKRGIYLGDAIAMLMRKSSGHISLDPLVLGFLARISPTLATCPDASAKIQDHKKVVYALLSVLARAPKHYLDNGPSTTIEDLLAACHAVIPVHHLFAMQPWRQYVQMWRALVAPGTDAASDDDDDSDDDIDDDAAEIRAEIRKVFEARLWTSIPDAFHIKYLGPDLIGADMGVAVLAAWTCLGVNAPWVSIFSSLSKTALDTISPYAQVFMHHDDPTVKAVGVHMVAITLPLKAAMSEDIAPDQFQASTDKKIVGLDAYAEQEKRRHHYQALLQALLTTMVMVPDAKERQRTLQTWQQVVETIAIPSRLLVLSSLIEHCPFPNATAVIVDRVRNEVARHWQHYVEEKLPSVVALLTRLLAPLPDAEFVQRSDVYTSALSLYRFVLLRDKVENASGLHSNTALATHVKGQRRRLTDLIEAQLLLGPAPHAHPCGASHDATSPFVTMEMTGASPTSGPVRYDLFRLQLMQGAFEAALDALVTRP
ncbi:hypothetical protein SPRG_07401 [Saprolegnia parasitica CBS 223.65]|uniref:Uncharacterized protein n=1 Tax=Saprolegnia parasitica (strain CBS 223.65) TaxID=695850 RepID=A0A067CLW0_SAPPC|nr:hypothetical protein SPRG_07401 [Saprolegnia parasitica CBS 223.65]KDO27802.1 hypothetical protein SPRG_07401 [Saprolegnia parasitica CBS 223.65]|eukprot:XP_012201577.1 hypothetical protein SPRG_07401 [Saprolegnia parasitica CBS 223.65]